MYTYIQYGNISEVEIRKKTLWVSVWHWDRYGRNQFLGEVCLPLSSLDLTDSTDKWFTLQDRVSHIHTRNKNDNEFSCIFPGS